MEPLHLDANGLAAALGVHAGRLEPIIADQEPVTSDLALRLAKCFRTSPQFWLGLQTAYDLSMAEARFGAEIEAQVQPTLRRVANARYEAELSMANTQVGRRYPMPVAGFAPSAKARALLRGVEMVETDLKAGEGTYRLAEVMRLLWADRHQIEKLISDDALLAVPGPGRERRFPAFQFQPDGILPHLRDVLKALPDRNPWFRLNFLVNPQPSLDGRTPFDVLRFGNYEIVVHAARMIGEMGA